MRVTTLVTLTVLSFLAVYDAVAVIRKDRNTISRIVWDNSKTKPWIPFLAGFVMGHLFW